jgi:hypothetical protein
MMGACVLFAQRLCCSNTCSCYSVASFIYYLEWIYLLASLTDFAEVEKEAGVRVYPMYVVCRVVFAVVVFIYLRSLVQLVLVVGLVWLSIGYIYLSAVRPLTSGVPGPRGLFRRPRRSAAISVELVLLGALAPLTEQH